MLRPLLHRLAPPGEAPVKADGPCSGSSLASSAVRSAAEKALVKPTECSAPPSS